MNLKELKKILKTFDRMPRGPFGRTMSNGVYPTSLIDMIIINSIEQIVRAEAKDDVKMKYIREAFASKQKLLEEQKIIKAKIKKKEVEESIKSAERLLQFHKEELKKL
jgi:hypothetical protein